MTVLTKQTSVSSDDCLRAECEESVTLSLTITDQIAGRDYDQYTPLHYSYNGGMRFLNITIPKGVTITSAYLKLKCNVSISVTVVNTRIDGEAHDNPATFSTLEDYDTRPRTTAYVDWGNIPAWTKDVTYTSPNLASIIQELVNRGGWSSGNALVLFWNEHGSTGSKVSCFRSAYSYNGSPSDAPTLEITYVDEGGAEVTVRGDGLAWIVV